MEANEPESKRSLLLEASSSAADAASAAAVDAASPISSGKHTVLNQCQELHVFSVLIDLSGSAFDHFLRTPDNHTFRSTQRKST